MIDRKPANHSTMLSAVKQLYLAYDWSNFHDIYCQSAVKNNVSIKLTLLTNLS